MAAPQAAALAAALGCLQPGIDPVFLALLSQAEGLALTSHGLLVAIAQAGMALGSLIAWWAGDRLRGRVQMAAGTAGAVSVLLLLPAGGLASLLVLRAVHGAAMGLVYARAMATCAAHRPASAYGVVFVVQLALATVVSLALPEAGRIAGPGMAVASLALVPLLAVALLRRADRPGASRVGAALAIREPVPAAAWWLAVATLLFVAATMMVWSFAGALAGSAGIPDRVIGRAVALGSIAGAGAAIVVMRGRALRRLPLPLVALPCGLALASPVALTLPGHEALFVAAIAALNIGSTILIVRCSTLAVQGCADGRFRTLVACTHSLGMIAGPLLGAAMAAMSGIAGLRGGVAAVLLAGLAATVMTGLRFSGRPDSRRSPAPAR